MTRHIMTQAERMWDTWQPASAVAAGAVLPQGLSPAAIVGAVAAGPATVQAAGSAATFEGDHRDDDAVARAYDYGVERVLRDGVPPGEVCVRPPAQPWPGEAD